MDSFIGSVGSHRNLRTVAKAMHKVTCFPNVSRKAGVFTSVAVDQERLTNSGRPAGRLKRAD